MRNGVHYCTANKPPQRESQQKTRSSYHTSRLNTGHAYMTHHGVSAEKNPPVCNTPDKHITIRHVLTECRKFSTRKNTEFPRISKLHPTTAPVGCRFHSLCKILSCIIGYDTLVTHSSRDWFTAFSGNVPKYFTLLCLRQTYENAVSPTCRRYYK